MKLKTPGEFVRAIKELRKYADGFDAASGFDIRKVMRNKIKVELTRSQKDKVARYFDVLQRHAGYKGTRFQKFVDKKKLREAQEIMGMPTRGSWRGVFVPQPDTQRAHLAKRRGKWVVEFKGIGKGLESVFVPFDKVEFAERGVDYVAELLEGFPDDWRYNLDMGYGRERWKRVGTKRIFLEDLDTLVMRNQAGQSGSSSFEDYMLGVHIYRGGSGTSAEYQTLKIETLETARARRREQEKIRDKIKVDRRRFKKAQERAKYDPVKEREKLLKRMATVERQIARQEKKEKK